MLNSINEISKAKEFLEDNNIKMAICATIGWSSSRDYTLSENPCYTLHRTLKEFLFNTAFSKLPREYQKSLITKLVHRTHFTNGVSKSHAMEYYFLSPDAFKQNDSICGLEGGQVKLTQAMKAYWTSMEETVVAIAEGVIDITNLVKVSKQLSC